MLSFTTGAMGSMYTPAGINGDINILLWPIQVREDDQRPNLSKSSLPGLRMGVLLSVLLKCRPRECLLHFFFFFLLKRF